ncbi:hypothetical protein [Sorangium sp. So ce1024]|uniref:hypothetical protein n=1 Tax=unclassified Sorangium TaxID=2621164 RepID=UPI003F0117B8
MQRHGSSAQGRGATAVCVQPPVGLKNAGSSRLPSAPLRSASLMGAICLLLLACDDGASSGAGRSSSALTSNDGSTGVTECDSYLDQYELCMQATLPSHQFNQQQNGIRRQRTAWKTMADSPFKKQALAHVCRQAITTARQELQACTWTGGL